MTTTPRPIPSDSPAFKHRQAIGILAVLSAVAVELLLPPLVPEGSVLSWGLGAVGWAFFMAYVTMRLWSILWVGGRKGRELVTQGPYALTRNPLYVGSLCFGLSCAAFLQSLVVLGATCVVGLIYGLRVIPAEERALEAMHGETFRAYRALTPRFLPRWPREPGPASTTLILRGIRGETFKLWRAGLMPPIALLLTHARHLPWWPRLPI